MVEKVLTAECMNNMKTPNGIISNDSHMPNQNAMMNELNFVRHKLEHFQKTIIKDVERRMSGLIEEVMQAIQTHELQTLEFRNFAKSNDQQRHSSNTWNNRLSHDDDDDAAATTNGIKQKNISTTDAATTTITDNDDERNRSHRHHHKRRPRALPDKIFTKRESYLTALLEVNHMKTIYHIFYIILIIFLLNSVCYDYFVEGRVNFGLGTFKTGLTRIHYVLLIWLLQHVFIFSLYYAFDGWATVRAKLQGQDSLQSFWSHSCLIVYIGSQVIFLYVASHYCLALDLPFVSASVLLLESTRLLMKMHSYVRTNVPRVLAGKLKTDATHKDTNDGDNVTSSKEPTSTVVMPTFSSYLYFLFAPTLIYRDHYPRTTQIRWKFALSRFMEVVAVAFLYSYIHERHIAEHFSKFGVEELNASSLIVKLFGMLMPGVIIFLCGFYLILHSWLNFTSELLRFGDRMFYKDWWTSTTYDAYFRNWNVVVHDWLYEFIYKDFYVHIFKGSKLAASLMVFLISALVHEHILGFALQLFFPVMFFFFAVIGFSCIFLTRLMPSNLGNIYVWFSLIIGNGAMFSLYAMEYYARFNCPKTYNTWMDYLTPAVWNCYKT